jgi:hypothetical protein
MHLKKSDIWKKHVAIAMSSPASSIGAVIGFPCLGHYPAMKFAPTQD